MVLSSAQLQRLLRIQVPILPQRERERERERIHMAQTVYRVHCWFFWQEVSNFSLGLTIRWTNACVFLARGKVKTLNFGTQPSWEPMWAIDHRSKRIVEVPKFPSRDVRTALLQRNALRDFVLYHNSLAKDRAGRMLKRCFSSLVIGGELSVLTRTTWLKKSLTT